jgi:hypothetical protein
LLNHPECYLRRVKELHYFNGLDFGQMDWQRKDNLRRLEGAQKRLAAADDGPALWRARRDVADRADWARVQDLPGEDDQAYLAYLNAGRRDERLIADMTPAYSLLSSERLSAMSGLTGDVRFIYLMRDPLARLWSHVRMVTGRKAKGTPDYAEAQRVLTDVVEGRDQGIAERSDYGATRAKLTAAIPAARRLIMTFEEMLAGGLAKIQAFLGIATRSGPARKVHAGPELDLKPEDRARALAWLRPQYEHVTRFFGTLPEGWDKEGLGVPA